MLWWVVIMMTCVVTALTTQEPDIDVTILSSYLKQLKDETLGVGKVQKNVNNLSFEKHQVDGNAFVDQLVIAISRSMTEHVKMVERLKSAIEETLGDGRKNSRIPCCKYPESSLTFNANFKPKVDTSNMCEIIAASASANLQSLSPSILRIMLENRAAFPSVKWQYVATRQGLLTLFPAQMTRECSFIDPRFRPWYVATAKTRRNNVLILMDVSRSMADRYNSQPLIEISKSAIRLVMKVLTPNDRVGLIAFNNTAVRPGGCFKNQLALASETNLKALNQSLNKFVPKGESVYSVGFADAFKLIQSTMSRDNDTTGDWTIMLITDGQPKEMHLDINKVYETIKAGNAIVQNKAKIFVYGVGRDVNMEILHKIASQNFYDVTVSSSSNTSSSRHVDIQGAAFHIKEPSMLRNTIGLFSKSHDRTNPVKPVVSAPYMDGGGLGLIFTVGLPIIENDNSLFGVVAVDIALQDIFKDVMYLNDGQNSYAFVVADDGRVIIHPLMPQPANHNDSPNFIKINQLEQNHAFEDIMASIQRRERGNKTFEKAEVLPVGNAIQIVLVNATYFWRPIDETNFSICLVLRENGFKFTLDPKNAASLLRKGIPMFRYHRLDLEVHTKDLCRHFYHKSTVSQSIVLFAPRCFEEPFLFSQDEPSSFVSSATTFFNELLKSTSADEIYAVIANHPAIVDKFAQGVISDVIWTSLVDALWVNNTDVHVANRYIGTKRGVSRIFPGARLPGGFDVTTRTWYELAIANPDQFVITPPYQDGAGAGNVVSFSHAITIPHVTSQFKNSSVNSATDVIGVMGVDLLLDYLFSIVQELYPDCNKGADKGWYCMLVDNKGNIVLHPDYSNGYQQNIITVKHIANDKYLMDTLMKKKFISRRRCLDFEKKVYKSWYELKSETFINEINSRQGPLCNRYFIQKVPGTNIFFVARLNIRFCAVTDCPSPDHTCRNGNSNSWKAVDWECPCTYPLLFNACTNAIRLDDGIAPCFPDDSSLPEDRECIPEYLPQCFDPSCKEANFASNCSGLVGCTWCSKTLKGRDLITSYCSPSEKCYNGLEGNKWIGYNENSLCEIPTSTISALHLSLISAGACIVLIIVLACFIYFIIIPMKKKANKKAEKYSDDDSNVSTYDDPLAQSSGRFSPGTPSNGNKGQANPRKQSDAPRVIITIVDSKGSEIMKKPVVIIQGDKVYGAPPPSRNPRNEVTHQNGTNPTPPLHKTFLRNRKRTEESELSSNNESGIHSDSTARMRSTSTGSGSSAAFRFDRSCQKRSQPSKLKNVLPAVRRIPKDDVFQRDHVIRRAYRSRENLHQKTQESKDLAAGYTSMRSVSAANITDDCDVTMVKALRDAPRTNRSKSVDNLDRPLGSAVPSLYVKSPQRGRFNTSELLHTSKHRHFSNPSYGGTCHGDDTSAIQTTSNEQSSGHKVAIVHV